MREKNPDTVSESEVAAASCDWFERWFGQLYLELYPHRDEEEARAGVQLLAHAVSLSPETRVLDLACGAGRHLQAMESEGILGFGLDLSWPLLQAARRGGAGSPLVRADMRSLPFGQGSFGAVVSFFTSFGYFATRQEDQLVATEIRRVLRAEGLYVLDFLNAEQIAGNLTAEDVQTLGQVHVRQRRSIENGCVVKRITVTRDGSTSEFVERVRLYERSELEELLNEAGLSTRLALGSYDGSAFTSESPRLILLGHAI